MTDPMDNLDQLLANVPGGAYLGAMLKNNPEARAALENMDPNDPQGMETGLRALLGAMGMRGPQAEMMMNMARSMMNDPQRMQDMMGNSPFASSAFTAAEQQRADVAKEAALQLDDSRPLWEQASSVATALIDHDKADEGFALMHRALDADDTTAFDPRDSAWEEMESLLETLAAESQAYGRAIPMRFGSLYQRLAWFYELESSTPPAEQAEFDAWCLGIFEVDEDVEEEEA